MATDKKKNYKLKLKKYPNGGKVKPIIVTDPNDPRLKAYEDSTDAYNTGQQNIKNFKSLVSTISPYAELQDANFNNAARYGHEGKPKTIVGYNNKGRTLYVSNIGGDSETTRFHDKDGVFVGNPLYNEKLVERLRNGVNYYEKPVQPVVYQKPVAKKVEETINIDPRGKGKGYGKLDPNVEYEQIGASLYRPITKPKFKPKAKPVPVDTATTPIIVTDPNDPRLKAYNDSLNLFNKFPTPPKGYKVEPYVNSETAQFVIGKDKHGNDIVEERLNVKNAIDPVGFTSHKANKEGKVFNKSKNKYEDFFETMRPIYKEPVQPVVYQKPKPTQQPTKPLPFKAKYNMPDTSASPNMQGEYPLRTFYQGTNTQREADSIEDVKGLERIKLQEYMRNNPKKKKFGGKIKYAPGGTVSNTLPTGSDPSDPMGLLTTAGGAAVPGLNIATTLAPMAIASAERNYSKMRDKIGANNTIQASDMTDYAQFLDPMTLDTVNNLPDFAKRDPRYKSRIDTQAKTAFVNQQPITRVDTGSEYLFPDGGMMPEANAELEKQEVFQTPDGTVGNVDGPSHSNGGVDVNLPAGTKIWSDRLKSGNKTFAQKAKVITNKINRLEKLPNRKYDRTIESTLNIFNGQLDGLFVEQESLKEAMGVDDSGNTFSHGGTMKYPSRGTFDPFEDIITYQDQDIDNPVDPVDNSNFRFYEYDRPSMSQEDLLGQDPSKPLNMKRSNGLEMPKVSVNERDVLPYIGPANLFMSSFQKDPVNRIRNKMAGPAMADMVAAEQMLPTRFDITPQLGEVKSADRSFRKAVGERTTGSNTAAILNASKANNLRLKANLYGEKFNKENSMDMARAEVRSNIGRFRASLGAEDANYERQYNVDKLQDSAGRRGMRNSAISNLASNKMQNTNDKMKIKLLKDIFPNADLSQALKTLELFNTEG